MASETPRARYRPKGQGTLIFERDGRRHELSLDVDSVDLPPPGDPRRAAPPPRAQVVRVEGGHALVPFPGSGATLNHQAVARRTVLHGGDVIAVGDFAGRYVAAREEVSWPLAVVVWPPSGPAVEIRSHRERVTIGSGAADLQIDDEALDPVHCTIHRSASGLVIADDGSRGGVVVDGRRVARSAHLRDGAEIRIGRTRLAAWSDPDARGRDTPGASRDASPGAPLDADRADTQRAGPLQPDDRLDRAFSEADARAPGRRRRTFDDDVPTRLEHWGERAPPRAQDARPVARGGRVDAKADPTSDPRGTPRRPPVEPERDGYHRYARGGEPPPAPPRARDDDDDGFGRRKGGGLTLVHDPGRPRKR